MWLYSFTIHSEVTSLDVSAEIITSSCMKPSNLAACLWDSDIGMYFDGSSYTACDSDCAVCRTSFSCSMCKDPFCNLCNDMETSSCSQCFNTFENDGTACVCPLGTMRKKVLCVNCYYQCGYCNEVDPFSCTQCNVLSFSFDGLCLPVCPVLSVIGIGSCTQSSISSITYNFYDFPDKVADTSGSYHIDNNLNPAKFSFMRGKYFKSIYSVESFAFGPFFSIEIFCRIQNYGFIFRSSENDGLSLEIKFDNSLSLSFFNTSSGFSEASLMSSFGYNQWTYILISFSKSSSSTLVKFYKFSIPKNFLKHIFPCANKQQIYYR